MLIIIDCTYKKKIEKKNIGNMYINDNYYCATTSTLLRADYFDSTMPTHDAHDAHKTPSLDSALKLVPDDLNQPLKRSRPIDDEDAAGAPLTMKRWAELADAEAAAADQQHPHPRPRRTPTPTDAATEAEEWPPAFDPTLPDSEVMEAELEMQYDRDCRSELPLDVDTFGDRVDYEPLVKRGRWC